MAPRDATEPRDEEVLADPESFTVEQVVAVFARSSDDDVVAAQKLEKDGKARATLLNFARPTGHDDGEPRFSRERVLGPEGGQILPSVQGYVLAGAIHESDAQEFTRSELHSLVDAFLARPVQTEET